MTRPPVTASPDDPVEQAARTLRGLLLRVSRLADDLPEVTDLDLNPVIAKAAGLFAVDARIKVAPCPPQDPFFAGCADRPGSRSR